MLSGMGEGLLHERVAEWVGRLTARGHSTCLITNGILLSPDRQQQLIEAGIAQFQVSVHGLDAQTVETVIRNRFGSEVVRANLDHLARNRPAHLRVRINFVETATNSNARPMVEEFARERDFEFFYRREHSRAGAHGPGASARLNEGCGIFASVTFVSCDGEVLPCVNDVRGRSGLGNVRNLRWADVERWKQRVIRDSCWFGDCAVCDDDYRWVLMGQGGLDERAPERLSRSRSTGVAGRLEGAEER
jgi:MoaA/NifB/PqqE/SkfB family radical SAM enzyme